VFSRESRYRLISLLRYRNDEAFFLAFFSRASVLVDSVYHNLSRFVETVLRVGRGPYGRRGRFKAFAGFLYGMLNDILTATSTLKVSVFRDGGRDGRDEDGRDSEQDSKCSKLHELH
jgi:hypothetical protein